MRPLLELATAAALAGALALAAAWPNGGPPQRALASTLGCEAECPAGTRRTAFSTGNLNEGLSNGWFVVFESGCEATCAPVVECLPPNIPVVDAEGFRCAGAPGLSTFERDDEVDLSFGDRWDPARVAVAP